MRQFTLALERRDPIIRQVFGVRKREASIEVGFESLECMWYRLFWGTSSKCFNVTTFGGGGLAI